MNATTRQTDSFFLPYQQRWIEDGSRLKLMEKSRQIGMSWTCAYRAVRETAASGQRYDCWVASRDETQARLFLDDCRNWAGVLNLASMDLLGGGLLQPSRPQAGSLSFSNGRHIHCLSSSADAQAGKRGTRILDEFALHVDPQRLYGIAYPGITWGGQLEIVSTHRGSGNYFNRLVCEARENGNPKGISLHRVTLQNAVEQGFLRKLQAKLPPDDPRSTMGADSYLQFVRDGCPDEETWLQEYCCVPADDASAFLPLELIVAAEMQAGQGSAVADRASSSFVAAQDDLALNEPSPRPRSTPDLTTDQPWSLTLAELRRMSFPLYLGVDVGRDHDLTVLWLVELRDGIAWTRRLSCLQSMPFSAQEERLCEVMTLPNLRRCCIDATGIGRQFAERAQQRYGSHRVEAITLSAPMKEELAYPLRSALENHSLRIPPDPLVRADLRAVRRETGISGRLRFVAERGRHGHSDRFWALALALYAARLSETHRQLHAEAISGRNGDLF